MTPYLWLVSQVLDAGDAMAFLEHCGVMATRPTDSVPQKFSAFNMFLEGGGCGVAGQEKTG